MSEANKALVRQFFLAINEGNQAPLDEVIAPNYVNHDPVLRPETQHGRDAWKQGEAEFFAAFRDFNITVEDMVAEGDKVASRFTWRGTHQGELMGIPATGKQITVSEILIHRIADGKIVEGWISYDALGMMQQLGAASMPRQD